MRRRPRLTTLAALGLLVAVGLLAAACGGSGDAPALSDVRIGRPAGPNGAMYLTAEGYGTVDKLTGATTDVADSVETHESFMGADGTMGMRPLDGFDLPADGALVLEPGGLHLMLINVDRLDVGDKVKVTLHWESAEDMEVEAEVVDPADAGQGGQ